MHAREKSEAARYELRSILVVVFFFSFLFACEKIRKKGSKVTTQTENRQEKGRSGFS